MRSSQVTRPRRKKNRKKKKKGKDAAEAATDTEVMDGATANVTEQAPFTPIPEGMPCFEPPEPIAEDDWMDVSELCDSAMQGMSLGEMMESPSFRLFDSMSAIEIMDPKMDSGFNNSADMTLERAEESGILSKSLTHEELVIIWDELLMYYLLWLEGHTIVQTIFSCLYLQDRERYVQPTPLFGVFIDAFLAACRAARGAVLAAGVFDDEDFLPSMFGIDPDACVFSAKPSEITTSLAEHRKAMSKAKGSSSPSSVRVTRRLEFIGEYMAALVDLTKEGASDKSNAAVKRRLETCLGLVEQLGKEEETDTVARETVLRCFDASFNRKLLVPGPPRTVETVKDRNVVLGMWRSHLNELLLCVNIRQMPLMQVLDGAVAYKGEPNVLPRSVAQVRASEEGHVRRLILDSLEVCQFPPEALQHCKKVADNFVAHCESLLLHLLKQANANRARRFRRLAHVFVDFNSLQHEAWKLDHDLQTTFGANLRYPRPCWVWVMEHGLQAMIAKLCLGFSLELYDEAEFHMIYWYVDYLYGLRIHNLNDLYYAREQPAGGSKKKGGAKQQQEKPGARRGGSRPRSPPLSLLLLEATQAALRGLFRLLAFCLQLGLLGTPAAAVEGLAQRFVLRFRALENFSLPHLPSYKDFEASATIAQAPLERRVVLDAAQASFAETAQLIEKISSSKTGEDADARILEEAKAIKRVVVANQLAVTQLTRMVETGGSRKVVATTVHHPCLVSVQVQAAK